MTHDLDRTGTDQARDQAAMPVGRGAWRWRWAAARGRRPRRSAGWGEQGSGLEWLEARALLSLIPTSVSVTVSSAKLVSGQSETLTATVTTRMGDSTPTSADGEVTFYDGNNPLGTPQTLSGKPATATLTTSALAVGSHTITARYSGDSSFAPSRSGVEPLSEQTVIHIKGELKIPYDLVADNSGDLFLTQEDNGIGRVVEIKPDGSQTTVTTVVPRPRYAAVDGSGILYVSDPDDYVSETGDNLVAKIEGDGGKVTRLDDFKFPTGVATDASGDVFIAEWGKRQVVELKPDDTRTTFAKDLNGPVWGIAVDNLDDLFYTTNGSSVDEVSASGSRFTVFNGGSENRFVAADGSGDVFVQDRGAMRVVEVKADGTQTFVGSGTNYPYGRVAVNNVGDVFILETGNSRVVEVTAGVPVTVSPAT